jgi:hypothetical protein
VEVVIQELEEENCRCGMRDWWASFERYSSRCQSETGGGGGNVEAAPTARGYGWREADGVDQVVMSSERGVSEGSETEGIGWL